MSAILLGRDLAENWLLTCVRRDLCDKMSVANIPLSALMLGRRVVALALRVDLLLRDLPEVALVMAVL